MTTQATLRPDHSPRRIFRAIGRKKAFQEVCEILKVEYYLLDDPEDFAGLVRDVFGRLMQAAPNRVTRTIWRERLDVAVSIATGVRLDCFLPEGRGR